MQLKKYERRFGSGPKAQGVRRSESSHFPITKCLKESGNDKWEDTVVVSNGNQMQSRFARKGNNYQTKVIPYFD